MASILKCDQIQSTTSNVIFSNSAGTEYGRFDANGNLGIGTSTPTGKFQVQGGRSWLLANNEPYSLYVAYASGTNGYFIGGTSTSALAFSTADGTERMRIDSSGNTFIGTTSTVWDERVGIRPVASTGQVGLGVYSPSTTYQTSLIRVQSENPTGAAWNLFDGRGSGGAIKILIDGNGLINLYNGQIKFPASQNASSDANTLDDYEEGTWTPVFTTDGTAPTYTSTSTQGAYTKIGNVVFVTFYVYSSGGATGGTGNVRISGLPFTAAGSGGQSFSRILPSYLYWGAANKWSADGRNGLGWTPGGSSTYLSLYAASTTYANGVFEVGGCGYYYVS